MHEALADFRIEDDSVVMLLFTDGTTYRVNPKDLERYLNGSDVATVRRALKMRQQFIQRVLPPTMMVFLAAAIIGLGSHDMSRVQALLHPSGQASHAKAVHTVPSRTTIPANHTGKTLPASAAVATSGTSAASDGGSGSVGTALPTASSARRTGAAPASGIVPAATSGQLAPTVTQVTQPVTHTVQSVVQPVLAPVTKTVQPLLTPVTNAAGGLLKTPLLP